MTVQISPESTLIDVAYLVCTALHDAGTVAVLTGGSSAAFYAPDRVQSGDADFIITMSADEAAAGYEIAQLGFTHIGGTYSHPATIYTLEFPPGPLAIGKALVDRYDTFRRGQHQLLHVLTRSDTVCLCLSKFYFWDDRSSLVSALAVAASGAIDLQYILKWSIAEGCDLQKLNEFRDRYAELGQ